MPLTLLHLAKWLCGFVKLNPRAVIAGIVLVSALAWGSVQSQRINSCQNQNETLRQQVSIWESNARSQAIAMEASHAYQSARADLDRRADAARRVRASACVPVSSDATARLNAAARDPGLPVPYAGVDRGALLDFARDCEAEALKLDALQRMRK